MTWIQAWGQEMVVGKKKKRSHNIFPNDPSPFCSGLLSILNITSAVSLARHAGFERCHGQTRLPQRERLELRHASFFNIILKWNWLRLNRHGDKSRQHLAEAGSITGGRNCRPCAASSSYLRLSPALLLDDEASVLLEPTDWAAELWLCKGLKV